MVTWMPKLPTKKALLLHMLYVPFFVLLKSVKVLILMLEDWVEEISQNAKHVVNSSYSSLTDRHGFLW